MKERQYLFDTFQTKFTQNIHSFTALNAINVSAINRSDKCNHCGKNSVVARPEKDTD